MSYIAPDLAPLAARHVLLFNDQRGGGRSTLVADSASLDAVRFAENLEALRMHFGLRQLSLLAHSWGGAVAALYAARHPQRVRRLIIVNSIPVRHTFAAAMSERLQARRDSTTLRRLRELHADKYAAAQPAPGGCRTALAYQHRRQPCPIAQQVRGSSTKRFDSELTRNAIVPTEDGGAAEAFRPALDSLFANPHHGLITRYL